MIAGHESGQRVKSGVLVVDKPEGPTSHDLVAAARRLYSTKAVGHAGTLDPMATGVLLLLFGEATKLSPYLTFDRKRYVARVRFGVETDTLDRTGAAVERAPLADLGGASLEAALSLEAARRDQVPPVVSAIHVNGARAHERHRRGEAVPLAPRPVEVYALALLDAGDDHAVVDLTVSKGYYVRAFARDFAAALGTKGHLDALRRVASGPFELRDATPWPPPPDAPLLSPARAAQRVLPARVLTEAGERRARCGLSLAPEDFSGGELGLTDGPTSRRTEHARPAPAEPEAPFAWLSRNGDLVAIGREVAPGSYRVSRGFQAA